MIEKIELLAVVQAVSFERRPILQELTREVGRFVQEHFFVIVAVVVGLAILVMYLRE